MVIATHIARVLLGLIFLIFGVNGFLNFLPAPELSGDAATLFGVLIASGWLGIVKAIEIAGGIALLSGKMTPLGLFLLGPVIVNILIYHILLDPAGLVVALVITALEAFLVYRYWHAFSAIFKPGS